MLRETIVPAGYETQVEEWGLAPAVRVGDTLYCSGQIGFEPDGTLPAEAEVQIANAFDHVAAVLAAAGATFADVVELTSFHVGLIEQLGVYAEVRNRYIGAEPPAQTAIGVAELGFPGAIIELKVTAVVGCSSAGD